MNFWARGRRAACGRHAGGRSLQSGQRSVQNVRSMANTSVNVTELRSRLRAYLSRVRGGEEILIRDRNLAIAKIVPLAKTGDFDEETLALSAQGVVRLPDMPLDLKLFFASPSPHIASARLKAAIEAEREED